MTNVWAETVQEIFFGKYVPWSTFRGMGMSVFAATDRHTDRHRMTAKAALCRHAVSVCVSVCHVRELCQNE